MATITLSNANWHDMNTLFDVADSQTVLATASTWVIGTVSDGIYTEQVWTGSNFSYDGSEWIQGGMATKVEFFDANGNTEALISLNTVWNFGTQGFPTVWALLSGADTVTGSGGDDVLVVGSGNNTVNGGAGSDFIDYRLETGDSIVNLSLGTATIAAQGSHPAHTDKLSNLENIWAGGGNDTLTGNSGSNWLEGNAGNDKIYGGAGDDYINGGAGVNTLNGGGGVDALRFFDLTVSDTGVAVNANLATGSVTVAGVNAGTAINFESVFGSQGSDVLTGNGQGNLLVGGLGADTMDGGAGNDTYWVDNALDMVTDSGTDSNDTVFTRGVTRYTLGLGIENATMAWNPGGLVLANFGDVYGATATGYASTLKLTGNALNNTLTLDSGYYFPQSTLTGGGVISTRAALSAVGPETHAAVGNTGIDLTVTDKADAAIRATGYRDDSLGHLTERVSPISFPVVGGIIFNQTIAYGTATLNGGAGDDTLIGADGNDFLNGGTGADTMRGGAGSDTYMVDSSHDVVIETGSVYYQTDTVISAISLNTLWDTIENATLMNVATALDLNGNSSSNSLLGNAFNNTINGNDGDDFLIGNAGNDILNGDVGFDSLQGGAGNDTLNGGDGFDTADYSLTIGNLSVNLSLTGTQNTLSAGIDTLANIEQVFGGVGNDTLTGNNLANSLSGQNGNDTLNGGAGADSLFGGDGNDIMNGGGGSDTLIGDNGNDTFVLANKENAYDIFQYFAVSNDRIQLRQSGLGNIGDGDNFIENGVIKTTTGGFAKSAELVIFNSPISHDIYDVDNLIGNATSAYAVGDQRLFVVKNDVLAINDGNADYSTSGVYLFTSANADAVVSNGELKLLALAFIDTTTSLAVGNFLFA